MTPTEREALERVNARLRHWGMPRDYEADLRTVLAIARKVEALEGALRLARPWVVVWCSNRAEKDNAKRAVTQIDAALGDTPT